MSWLGDKRLAESLWILPLMRNFASRKGCAWVTAANEIAVEVLLTIPTKTTGHGPHSLLQYECLVYVRQVDLRL